MVSDYNCYQLSKKESIRLAVVLAISLFIVGLIFYQSVIPCFFAPIVYKFACSLYEKYLIKERKNALILQFKDFIYSISASFAAGRHMAEGLEEAKANLQDVYQPDDYMMEEINTMIDKIDKVGETDIAVLTDFADRSHIEDIEDFAEIFRACRETGGDFVTAINKSAAVIGEKITIENEIRTMVNQKKFEGRIITLMPVGIILFLRVMSPDYLDIMYTTLAGRLMMTIALVATVGAYLWIERITEIEV